MESLLRLYVSNLEIVLILKTLKGSGIRIEDLGIGVQGWDDYGCCAPSVGRGLLGRLEVSPEIASPARKSLGFRA